MWWTNIMIGIQILNLRIVKQMVLILRQRFFFLLNNFTCTVVSYFGKTLFGKYFRQYSACFEFWSEHEVTIWKRTCHNHSHFALDTFTTQYDLQTSRQNNHQACQQMNDSGFSKNLKFLFVATNPCPFHKLAT